MQPFLYHRQTDTSGADDRNGLAGHFIAQKWQVWMPVAPAVISQQMLGRPHLAS